ncbi:hypothetical protein F2Q68_00002200 [Brassica cretica]|uniref:Uncharacterized protein n=1 Tax=Brassica cretica TaxID=69181 RepID=A0A8S9J9I6_BRACR|nr:hypothetical protein F2Q68_00002200 [Brassica cretica]
MLRNEEDPTDGEARSAVEPAAARLDPMQMQAIISEIKRQLRLENEAVEVRVIEFSPRPLGRQEAGKIAHGQKKEDGNH